MLYGEYVGVFNINTFEMIEGDLPKRARESVIEWAGKYQNELLDIWHSQEFKKLPGLE